MYLSAFNNSHLSAARDTFAAHHTKSASPKLTLIVPASWWWPITGYSLRKIRLLDLRTLVEGSISYHVSHLLTICEYVNLLLTNNFSIQGEEILAKSVIDAAADSLAYTIWLYRACHVPRFLIYATVITVVAN